jgi:DNA-binding winged helix-turn-helix (wHTH) protein
MAQTQRSPTTIRFGPFEADLLTGELRKSGMRIRLQDQPFRVLASLLEKPGEVVTREELRRTIWPDGEFGDFDHAVNVAVAKLRTALNDSADEPRFVETLARRGYRFIRNSRRRRPLRRCCVAARLQLQTLTASPIHPSRAGRSLHGLPR